MCHAMLQTKWLHLDLHLSIVQKIIHKRSNKHYERLETYTNHLLLSYAQENHTTRFEKSYQIDLKQDQRILLIDEASSYHMGDSLIDLASWSFSMTSKEKVVNKNKAVKRLREAAIFPMKEDSVGEFMLVKSGDGPSEIIGPF